MFKKLPNSTRKFIRSEKARIRRQFLSYKQQKEAITNMYNKILNQPIVKKATEPKPVELEKTLFKKQKKETTKKPKGKVKINKKKKK